ncbi:MAG TPA: response regulator transcription factor [Actinomycetota bacterium]|nr:response regulator transcription factor [Actinomycetota bacterium]
MAMRNRIVLVDDDADMRELLRLRLEEEFDIIGEAADGRGAISLVKETQPDLVVMDLMMPHVDGLDAISEIKLTCPGTKIVVVTAAGRSLMAEAAGRGADGWVDKVSYGDELLGIIRSTLGHPEQG